MKKIIFASLFTIFTLNSSPAFSELIIEKILEKNHDNHELAMFIELNGAVHPGWIGTATYLMTLTDYKYVFERDYARVSKLVDENDGILILITNKNKKIAHMEVGGKNSDKISKLKKEIASLSKELEENKKTLVIARTYYKKQIKNIFKIVLTEIEADGINRSALKEFKLFRNISKYSFIISALFSGDLILDALEESREEELIDQGELEVLETIFIDSSKSTEATNDLVNDCVLDSNVETLQGVVTCMNLYLPKKAQLNISSFCEDESLRDLRYLIDSHTSLDDGGCDSYYNKNIINGVKNIELYKERKL